MKLFSALTALLLLLPVSVLADQDARSDYLWVPCYSSNNVYKVNIVTHEVAAVIPVGRGPAGVAVGYDQVYVTCRQSPYLFCISKAEDIVVDTIDLSSRLAFPIGVALDPSNRIYVVGRVNDYSYEMDVARLLKLDRDGTLLADVNLPSVQGDNWYPEWNQMAVVGIAINEPEIMLPWQRSWDVHTGIVITDTSLAEARNYPQNPFVHGYRGPGAAYDVENRGWSSGDREGSNYLIGHSLPDYWGYYRLGPWLLSGQIYGDVAVDDDGFVWTGSGIGILIRFDPRDHQATTYEIGGQVKGIAIDRYGYIWVAVSQSNMLLKFDSDGNQVGTPVTVGATPLGFGDMTGHEFGRRMTAVGDNERVPRNSSLLTAYPNPFNSSTQISYTLSEAGQVRITGYDMLGRRIAAISESFQDAGQHEVTWDVPDLPTGLYLIRLESKAYTSCIKICLIR